MKEGWEYRKLGDIVDILDGKRKPITKNKREAGKIPYYGATGVLDFVKDYIFDEKLVLLGEDGAKWGAGESSAYIIIGKSWINNHAHALRPHRQTIIDEYLVYYLNFSNLLDYITGVTVPKLNQEKMRSITIPIPPLSEQQRIVSLLDAQFERIDMLKRNAEHQLQAAKDLYERFIEQIFSDNNKWSETSIGDCFISINNGANIKQTKGASGIPITRIETLANGVFNPDRLGYANIEDASKYEKYLMKDGDLLMSHINSVEFTGRTVAYHNQIPVVIHGMNLLRLVPKDSIDSDFFVYLTKSKGFKESIRSITHKSVNQASFNTTALKAINIKVPDIEEQKVIVAKLDALSERVKQLQSNYEQTITLCNDLKQSLLKSIFA